MGLEGASPNGMHMVKWELCIHPRVPSWESDKKNLHLFHNQPFPNENALMYIMCISNCRLYNLAFELINKNQAMTQS